MVTHDIAEAIFRLMKELQFCNSFYIFLPLQIVIIC